jgi:hypothetical protein
MRIILTDPSDSVGDESGVAGSGSEVTSGDSLVWKDIVVADLVDVVGSVTSPELSSAMGENDIEDIIMDLPDSGL